MRGACDHRSMSDDDPNRGGNFEEVAKALAEEVSRAFERRYAELAARR